MTTDERFEKWLASLTFKTSPTPEEKWLLKLCFRDGFDAGYTLGRTEGDALRLRRIKEALEPL